MPAIADITVKKNDGTTDIVYAAQAPSSGDGTAAVWKSTTVGVAQAHQPEIRLVSKEADSGAARGLRSTYQYPQIATDSTTSLVSVVNKATASTDWKFPKGMTQADVNEFVSQYANLLKSTLIVACVKAGYSAS
jgi:hypothetical protein